MSRTVSKPRPDYAPAQPTLARNAQSEIHIVPRTRSGALSSLALNGEDTFVAPSSEAGYYLDHIDERLTTASTDDTNELVQRIRPSTVKSQATAAVVPFPAFPESHERFRIVQQWEGTVTEIGAKSFTARLRDLTVPDHPEEQAVFSADEIDENDRELLQVGAVFYWSMGYHHDASGTRRLSNDLRFRRLPRWTRTDVDRLVEQSEFADLFTYDR